MIWNRINNDNKTIHRSSHQRCSIKKGVFRNFLKFIGKHICQSLFFNKVAGLNTFLQNTCGRLLLDTQNYLIKNPNINPTHPVPWRRKKKYLNFYFHTSLWCQKQKFKLIFILIQISKIHRTERIKIVNLSS